MCLRNIRPSATCLQSDGSAQLVGGKEQLRLEAEVGAVAVGLESFGPHGGRVHSAPTSAHCSPLSLQRGKAIQKALILGVFRGS
jgi:hypothetical protein